MKIRNISRHCWCSSLRLRRTWSFHVLVLQRTAKIYNTRAQQWFCSWNLLYGGLLLAVIVMVCLSSLLIHHENRGFRKRSSNRSKLKTPALRFRVDGKHFENEAFRKRWRHDYHWIPCPRFPQTQIQNDRWLLRVLNFSGVLWTKNIWCVFRV